MGRSLSTNNDYYNILSGITIAHDTLNHLLSDGTVFSKKGDVSEAFHCFSEAEKMLEQNNSIFTVNDQIQTLKRIKSFYEANGYAIERRTIIKN